MLNILEAPKYHSVHGVDVSLPNVYSDGKAKEDTLRPSEKFVPSESLLSAIQRTGEEGHRKTLIERNGIFHIDVEAEGLKVTVTKPGSTSGEFNNAGYFGPTKNDRTIKIDKGQGMVMLQKSIVDANGERIIEEFRPVELNENDPAFVIPADYDHTIVNIGKDDLIVRHSGFRMNDSGSNDVMSRYITKMEGFAYRAVSVRNGQTMFELNPHYKPENIRHIGSGRQDAFLNSKKSAGELSG